MRLQLALNVSDLDKAVDFYGRMFGVGPAKTRPGYANFAIDDPPLKLVLFENAGEPGSINHLGVETETADEVVAAEARLERAGLETTGVDDTVCCYAEKTETWVAGPDGALGVVRQARRHRTVRQRRDRRRRYLLPDLTRVEISVGALDAGRRQRRKGATAISLRRVSTRARILSRTGRTAATSSPAGSSSSQSS